MKFKRTHTDDPANHENEYKEDEYNDAPNSLAMFVCGALAGSALALLFAPASGRATRRSIRAQANKQQRRLREGVDEAVDTLTGRAEAIVAKGEALVAKGEALVAKGKERIAEESQRVKNRVAEESQRVQAAVDAGKAAYREHAAS